MFLSFRDLGLQADLCDALEAAGIAEPFPVQSATLPDALAGRDVCGMAPTGSGKTLAYGLALIASVPRARPGRPAALVLVPTRELAQQVAQALTPFAKVRGRWVTAVFGGAAMMRQISDLRRGVDIMVATPGRLTDLVERGECELGDVSLVVVDEADRMADMGFTPQVTWLLDKVSAKRQVLLFSATLDGDVKTIIDAYLHDPVHHQVEGQHTEEDEADVLARAPHYRVAVKHETKIETIAAMAVVARRTVVFVKNRFATERVADQITEGGVRAYALHGGMTQNARERAVQSWARGEVNVLVATDVAARGLHVDGLDLVIHLDPPQDEKDYVHRSGRTARAGGRGVIVNLLRKEQQRASQHMFRRLGIDTTESSIAQVVAELTEIVATARPIVIPERPARRSDRDSSRRDFGSQRNSGPAYGRPRSAGGDRSESRFPRHDAGRGSRQPFSGGGQRNDGAVVDASAERSRHERSRSGDQTRADRGWPAAGGGRTPGERSFGERESAAPRSDQSWGERSPRSDRGWNSELPNDRSNDRSNDRPRHRTGDPTPHGERRGAGAGPNDRSVEARPSFADRDGRSRPAAPRGERSFAGRFDRGTSFEPRPERSYREPRPATATVVEGGDEIERRVARFDEAGQPMNRRARRALQFGATAEAADA